MRIMGQLREWSEEALEVPGGLYLVITVDWCSEELGGLAESHFL